MPEWMSDPMTWSIPAGRYFGIRVRIHLAFVLFVVARWLNALIESSRENTSIYFWYALGESGVLFFSVLLHEFGHCFAARAVGGDADEILMWPLGGLAMVSAPNTPRAQYIVAIWGPMVNLVICVIAGGILVARGLVPPLNPFNPLLFGGTEWLYWTSFTFKLNWVLILFNLVPAFPMDGGRILRCILWKRLGLADATLHTVQVAKICAIVMGLVGFIQMMTDKENPAEGLLLIGVACFVYHVSSRERLMLESGMYDDSPFGDFSQGYLSLNRSQPKPKTVQLSWWERWRRKKERKKRHRELVAQKEEERLMDEILQKLHRDGMASLSEQEKRFLTRTSEKYRSRGRAE
jgi:Zn-dependent protease